MGRRTWGSEKVTVIRMVLADVRKKAVARHKAPRDGFSGICWCEWSAKASKMIVKKTSWTSHKWARNL